MMLWLSVLLFGLGAMAAEEFPAVMAESNLEKRSELALLEADRAVTAAKKAYEEKNMQDFKMRVADVEELVQLSYQSLQDTGKRARKSPKFFKRAELAIRALLRRLDSLANEVSAQDRDIVTAAYKNVNQIHDNVLHDIMTKK